MADALIVFLGIATWRLTYMLNHERGPLDIFVRWRAALAKAQKRMGGIYDMVSCFSCLSVWVAMLPAAYLQKNFLTFIGYTLILSGIAILTQRVFDKLK